MLKSVESEQGFFSDSATSVGWGVVDFNCFVLDGGGLNPRLLDIV